MPPVLPIGPSLTIDDRAVWFASPDLSTRCQRPSPRCPLGPFPSAETLGQFGALARSDHSALAPGRWGPDAATFTAGYTRLCAAHGELSRDTLGAHARLLRLGTRLWREGRRDRDEDEDRDPGSGRRLAEWTPELVQLSLKWLVLRAALARRRAIWLTRLVDAAVVWSEPGVTGARLIVIENGEIVLRRAVDSDETPPIAPATSVQSPHVMRFSPWRASIVCGC